MTSGSSRITGNLRRWVPGARLGGLDGWYGDNQFTCFQQVGGLEYYPVMGEITYGLERLALYPQGVEDFRELIWTETGSGPITAMSICNTRSKCQNSTTIWLIATYSSTSTFMSRKRCGFLKKAALPPIFVMKASHTFNLLTLVCTRHREATIHREVRTLARGV